jgi:hypothetical protein
MGEAHGMKRPQTYSKPQRGEMIQWPQMHRFFGLGLNTNHALLLF